MQWSLNQMFVAFYLWVRAMLLGVWCMKWYSRNGGRLNIRICVSGSHVGNDEQGVVLYFYVIVYDSRMSLSNVSLPIWHWCSPSVLPLTHPSPFSPKPALEEPRRTSHPERGKKKNRFFRCSLPTAMSISRSEIFRRKKKKREVEKPMGDHGRSMGGHVRSVGVMGGQ